MRTKNIINRVIVVTNCQERYYTIGHVFSALDTRTIDRIENFTTEYSDALHVSFVGYDKNNNVLFELINLPVEVTYKLVPIKEEKDGWRLSKWTN